MSRIRLVLPALAGLVTLLLAPPGRADRLVTEDGRILEVKRARKLADGNYHLTFESGEIVCPARYVASVEIEGDMSDYVPANEDEKKKLESGYVRYSGKWLSKAAYQAELKKQSERTRARTAELAAHADFYNAWEKETKHFEIKSDTSPEILDYYAELLEAYYDLMDQRVGIAPSPMLKKTKMKVSVYKSRREFQKLTQVSPGVAGFFNFVDGELHFYHDYQDPSISNWVALHEGTHLLTFLIEPQARPWIWVNEGVADYFGSADIQRNKRGKLEIQPGRLSLERVLTVQQAMADGSYIPLEKLFFVPRDDFHSFEYAHAWSFVYFLNNSRPEYEKGFKRFFKDFYTISKGVAYDTQPGGGNQYGSWKVVPPTELRRLLLERIGVKDVGRLDDEWKAFITGIPIDAPLARLKRGLQSLQAFEKVEDLKNGIEDLNAAIEAGVDDSRAFWTRGTLRIIVDGDIAKAEEDYRKAVELAPLQAVYRANLAELIGGLSLALPGLTVEGEDEEELQASDEKLGEAETLLGLACELEPENDYLRTLRDDFYERLRKKTEGK